MTALVAGVAMTAAARGDERATRPAKVAGVSFRAASTTVTEGYDKAALDGRTLYIAPQVMLTGDQVTAVRTRQGEDGGAALSLSLTEQAAGRLGGKGAADHVAVFVDSQLITVGALSVQDGAATITGLTSGQAERVARLLTRGSVSPSAAAITVVPVSQSNGDYVFDAYAQNVSGLRTYQVKLTTAGGDRGSLTLSDVRIDDARSDYVFFGKEAIKATDQGGSRLGGTLFDGTVDATAAKYLGTWVFHASADAAGTFQIQVARDEESFLMDLKNDTISSSAAGATVPIGDVSPRLNR
ncbi:MAG: hypothetical protein Q7R41_03855 [Phycisphaerales bacterium]|nr:hypothetical protein [Phycisphaerales bacterium]